MGYAGLPDGTEWIRDEVTGQAREAAEAGRELARRMLAAGAGDLLQRAEAAA
jgi:porphobilinogen deaminase